MTQLKPDAMSISCSTWSTDNGTMLVVNFYVDFKEIKTYLLKWRQLVLNVYSSFRFMNFCLQPRMLCGTKFSTYLINL